MIALQLADWLCTELEKKQPNFNWSNVHVNGPSGKYTQICAGYLNCAMIDNDMSSGFVQLYVWGTVEKASYDDSHISVPKITYKMGWKLGGKFELADPKSFENILKKILLHYEALEEEEKQCQDYLRGISNT